MDNNPLFEVYTTTEAAERLETSSRQVARYCDNGLLVYREAKGGHLILKESVENLRIKRLTKKGKM
ncbi:helix-turn-helix domain-containing protein [Paenibacillus sp. L3-i20]|uniref:helix-turn-helix domain-containing protein n=1 Tax=Paenibacillus sp. L3-i20 TaxID=2905833 RepID=UPI001EDCD63C|nr:helix-turn-helix domain-containing protein [Paenibacillus sp. L3-i20]GKU79830.1 hypothetical protein L3i20_v242270 [Paenibacillus sp. L3-i20]